MVNLILVAGNDRAPPFNAVVPGNVVGIVAFGDGDEIKHGGMPLVRFGIAAFLLSNRAVCHWQVVSWRFITIMHAVAADDVDPKVVMAKDMISFRFYW